MALLAINRHPLFMRSLGGGLPPRWIFADTGDEPEEVYSHLKVMSEMLGAEGFEVHVVSRDGPGLSEHVLSKESGASLAPFYVSDRHGKPCPIRRGCTQDFKVKPIKKKLVSWFGRRPKEPVTQIFGISADESQRMRLPDRKWLRFKYPLVEMGWNRERCLLYLSKNGVNAPRSACVFCPFHSTAEWKRLRRDPIEFQKAVEFEKSVHVRYDAGVTFGLKTKPYLHPSRVPLGDVDFDRQMSLFSMDDECAGVCGI